MKSIAFNFFILIFCSSIVFSKGDSTYFQIRDSIISSFKIDGREISSQFLTANVSGKSSNKNFKLPKNISGCYNPIITYPQIENKFDGKELELLRAKPNATFEDSLYFLLDNDITSNLYRVKFYNRSEVTVFEKIGLDINVNFPEVIEVSYFLDEKIKMTENLECGKRIGVYILHLFGEEGEIVQSIIYRNGQTEIISHNEK